MKNYANAKDVLPKELFEDVKKYYTGMLYIPEGTDSEAKRKLVIVLWKQKTAVKEIAMMSGLGPRRVHQIIAEERDKTHSQVAQINKNEQKVITTLKEL